MEGAISAILRQLRSGWRAGETKPKPPSSLRLIIVSNAAHTFSAEVAAYLRRQGLVPADVAAYGAFEHLANKSQQKPIGYLGIPLLTRDGTNHEWQRWYGDPNKKHLITPDSGDAIFIAPPPGKTVEDIKSAKVVVITESPIKAIVAAQRAGYFAIAGNGCGWLARKKGQSYPRLHPHLVERLGGFQAMQDRDLLVIIALDADADTNQEVADAEKRLQQACERAGVRSVVARLVPCEHPGHQCKDLGDVLAQHGPVPIGLMLGGAYAQALRARQATGLVRAAEAARRAWQHPLRPPIPSGIDTLDQALCGGLHAESVYVLAAPTGRGKTGLAIQIANHISEHHPVIFVSTELTERQVLARFAAQRLRVAWQKLYQAEDGEGVANALENLSLYVLTDQHAVRIEHILSSEGQKPFLVIDYLQVYARRLAASNEAGDVRTVIGRASMLIADWTRNYGITSLVVSSVSREWHKTQSNKTAIDYVASAKEAGEIEYDAAGVMYLDADLSEPVARLHVAKHRFGPSGHTIGLRFDGAVGLFVPDKEASLTEDQRTALQLIREGKVDSGSALADVMEIQKKRALEIVRDLKANGLVQAQGKKIKAALNPTHIPQIAGTDLVVPAAVPGSGQSTQLIEISTVHRFPGSGTIPGQTGSVPSPIGDEPEPVPNPWPTED
jgi:predicted ATP-dependent serine protease